MYVYLRKHQCQFTRAYAQTQAPENGVSASAFPQRARRRGGSIYPIKRKSNRRKKYIYKKIRKRFLHAPCLGRPEPGVLEE